MIDETRVIAECYADTLLINMILRKKVTHGPNTNEVAKVMIKKPIQQLIIGIIDNDKNKPTYFNEFIIQESRQNCHFKIYKHRSNNHYFLIIDKAHEDFIIKCATEVGLNTAKYAKYFNAKFLKSLTKSVYIDNNSEYKQFLNDIIQKRPASIVELRSFINTLLN
ncbi:MAG: hypothetical protein WCL14_08705 [Bacteroidota bacterium]